jgi:hypothetical protein
VVVGGVVVVTAPVVVVAFVCFGDPDAAVVETVDRVATEGEGGAGWSTPPAGPATSTSTADGSKAAISRSGRGSTSSTPATTATATASAGMARRPRAHVARLRTGNSTIRYDASANAAAAANRTTVSHGSSRPVRSASRMT